MTAPASVRGRSSPLVCADWSFEGREERSAALELTETAAFIATESLPPVGTEVDLNLRFAKRAPMRVRRARKQGVHDVQQCEAERFHGRLSAVCGA